MEARIEQVEVSTYTVPTDRPESDGTLEWDATTAVVVEVRGGGKLGLGLTYGHASCAELIRSKLASLLQGLDALDVPRAWDRMECALRNYGRPGICSMAIAAVDLALWDLKGKLLGLSVADLLGRCRDEIEVYGSGGFTSYSDEQLAVQFRQWAEQGIRMFKMKVGREPGKDAARVAAARAVIGPDAELFVDANGAYSRKQALEFAYRFEESGVCWFEEPVTSDDLDGMRLLRNRCPPSMQVTTGEYAFLINEFRELLRHEAVDVLQADITRCAGMSELQRVAGLAEAFKVPLSTHTAPALHVHAGCAFRDICHLEYFHDHERIERLLFDGAPRVKNGRLRPDRSRPGLGLELRRQDAEKYRE